MNRLTNRRAAGTLVGVAVATALVMATAPAPAADSDPIAAAARGAAAAIGVGGDGSAAPYRRRVEREGIAVEVAVDPLAGGDETRLREGDPVRVRFAVTDVNTGTPMPSLYPAAWLDLLPTRRDRPDTDCKTKVETFVGGTLFSRAELDLNVYYVLALNDDASISVVDPLFGFGGSKLLTTIPLRSPGEDWALSADGERLFVALPGAGQVAVVETATWNVVYHVDLPAAPRTVALQPDGAYLWVSHDGGPGTAPGVAVVSTTHLKTVARVATGAGPHDIAFSADDRFAFVASAGAGTLSIVDVAGLVVTAEVATGPRPISVAYSRIGKIAYVADERSGTLVGVDGERGRVVARLEAEPGLARVRFTADGRFGFAVNPTTRALHIIDAATQRIVQTGEMEAGPDDVAFSDELAYVRHRESEIVLMVPLDAIGKEGAPIPVIDFPGGTHPPGRSPMPTRAASMVQAPGAAAMLVANPLDRAIYYYKEGMAAPMGHFQNYGRQPRAVLVVDRSLRETAAGVYETVAQLRRPGRYELALYLDSPRIVHCFDLEVAADPAREVERPPAVVRPLAGTGTVRVDEEVELAFRLTDPLTDEPKLGLADATLLILLAPGIHHSRQLAEAAGDGVYRVRYTPHQKGVYYAFLAVPSLGLDFNASPYLLFEAKPAATPGGAADGSGTRTAATPGEETR